MNCHDLDLQNLVETQLSCQIGSDAYYVENSLYLLKDPAQKEVDVEVERVELVG